MFNSDVFHSKVIHDEAELDRTPFVAPEARGGFNFIIAFNEQAGPEEIVGKNASLG